MKFNESMKMNYGFDVKIAHPKGYVTTMKWTSVKDTVDALRNGYKVTEQVGYPRAKVLDITSVRIPSYSDITMGGRYSCD